MCHPKEFFNGPPDQGPVGTPADPYLKELPASSEAYDASIAKLPGQGKIKLDRSQVRKVCLDRQIHPLVAYACVMAWGGRNFSNYRRSIASESVDALVGLLKHLRDSKQSRKNDFAHTQNVVSGINGLGISFYTKLLFFFRPNDDSYILDQWTAKSALVLFSGCGVRVNSAGLPRPDTSPEVYEAFCRAIEVFGTELGPNWTTGEEVERTLFDHPRGKWRAYLKRVFPAKAKNPNRPSPVQARASNSRPISSNSSLMLRFANDLSKRFNARAYQGLSLPGASLTFHKPNRMFCQRISGVLWQFIFGNDETRAQVHFANIQVKKYNQLINDLEVRCDGSVDDFGRGITGNGPRKGATRSMNLAVSGGYATAKTEWPDITRRAVQAMNELFEFVGDHLSD